MIKVAFILSPRAFADIYGPESLQAIAPWGKVLGPPLSAEEIATNPPPWLNEVEVVFGGWGMPPLDEAMLARLPRLRALFYGAGTVRFVVGEPCWERGLVVSTAAALNAIPTAEFAVGAILLSLKRAWHMARLVRATRTFPRPLPPVPSGKGATVGLVSLGQVGLRVAERLRDIDVNVVVHDPFAEPSLFAELGVESVSLDVLFASADIISLHTPLLPTTTGLVNAALLALLKPGATLINTARGGLICEADLLATLEARPDLQAILDVTDPEPPESTSRLFDQPNIFLTPHIAGSMGEECRRMGSAMIEEFFRYARGEPLRYVMKRDELARRA
jgi:phosphoglycerate dehydrogenase-like enzyme